MATTFADLEAQVRGLEARAQLAEKDNTTIIGTVVATRDDVRRLKRDSAWLVQAVHALLDHNGIIIAASPSETRRRLREVVGPTATG